MKTKRIFLIPLLLLLYIKISLMVVSVYAETHARAGAPYRPATGVTAMVS